MTLLDSPRPAAPERKPGDFRRTAKGSPLVSHPTETTKHNGNKADLIELCAERGIDVPERATVATLHELLGERPKVMTCKRMSSLGAALDPNPTNLTKWGERQLLTGVSVLAARGVEWAYIDLETKTLDSLAQSCHEAADTELAADRGTHIHHITDAVDHGRPLDDVIKPGEALGIAGPLQLHIAKQWKAAREAWGIRMIRSELPIVNDAWRAAGTADRLDEVLSDIVTPFGIVRAGQAVIGDTKTGPRKDDQYWVKYPVQVAGYALGAPYDTEADVRLEWDRQPSHEIAFIYHYDLQAAIAGESVEWNLIPVDLDAARRAGDVCRLAAEAAEWSVSALGGACQIGASSSSPEVERPEQADDGGLLPPPSAAPSLGEIRAMWANPDEGGPADPAAIGVLQRRYGALSDEQRKAVGALVTEAARAGVPIHLKDCHTIRRFEIVRGLVFAAEAGELTDETLRPLVAAAGVGDCAEWPSIRLGHAIGALDAQTAALFARMCEALGTTNEPTKPQGSGDYDY